MIIIRENRSTWFDKWFDKWFSYLGYCGSIHLKIRGEMIRCIKCGKIHFVEYEGGSRFMQLGEIVEMQKEFSKKYLPNYNAEKCGYYFYRAALCEDCADKDCEYDFWEKDNVLFTYFDKLKELEDLKRCGDLDIEYSLKKSITAKMLDEINHEAYIELKNYKHCGIKKEKRRAAEAYVEESKDKIHWYMENQLNSKLNNLIDEVSRLESEVLGFINKYKINVKGLTLLDMKGPRNLNSMDWQGRTVRVPKKTNIEEIFYEMHSYSKKEIKKMISDKKKLKFQKIKVEEDRIEYICRRMPAIMSKADIWE